MSDDTHRQSGMQEFAQLLERKPTLTDPDILLQLERIFIATVGHLAANNERINAAWERAVGESPKDQHLVELWLKSRLKCQDWKAAQKVRHYQEICHLGRRRLSEVL